MKRFISLLNIVLILGLLVAGCATPTPETVEVEVTRVVAEEEVEVEVTKKVEVEVTKLTPIIPPTTKLFDKDALNKFLVGISEDGALITFSEDVLEQKPLEEDDVLAIEPIYDAPDGLLRKVVAVTRSDGQVKVETVQATLDEAIEQGEVHETTQLTQADVRDIELSQGVTAVKADCSPVRNGFSLVINEELYDGVTATGNVNVEPSFDFDLVIRRFELQQFALINTTKITGKLRLEAEIARTGLDKNVKLGHINFAPFPVMVGTFPIWLTPKITFYVGVDGNVSADLTTGVTQEVTVVTGFEYKDGYATPINDSFGDYTHDPPTLSAGCEISVYLRPQFELLIYGAAGPYVAVNAYVKLKADPTLDPWWEMHGGVTGEVGVTLEILSHVLAGYNDTLFEWTKLIAPAETSTPTHTPAPTSTPTRTPCTSIWWPLRCWPWWLWVVVILAGLGILGSLFG